MVTYHGTSATIAGVLAGGGVSVTLGGGELGQGFYTGQHLFEAKTWAYHRAGDRQKNVVEFSTPDAEVEGLSLHLLDDKEAGLRRREIKRTQRTRVFRFGCDMVWAPIVGSARTSGDQYKWESNEAQCLLNGAKTTRSIV